MVCSTEGVSKGTSETKERGKVPFFLFSYRKRREKTAHMRMGYPVNNSLLLKGWKGWQSPRTGTSQLDSVYRTRPDTSRNCVR